MSETIRGVRAVIPAECKLHFEAFEVPVQPDPHALVVQVERTMVSAGTEIANYSGIEPDTRIPGTWCSYPWNPGYGGIGRVMAVSAEETRFQPGDRVFAAFKHASHGVIDTSRQYCVKVPDGLDTTTAAFVRMAGVAITAYQRSTVTLGDSVAMIGLGLVGNLAGQFFRIGGQRVIGIDPSERRRSIAQETGFHEAVDPSGFETPAAMAERLREVAGGEAPRVVVEAVGDSRLVEHATHLAARNGQVILLGSPRAAYDTNCTPMLSRAHLRGLSLIGALEWNIPLFKSAATGPSTESNAELNFRLIQTGELRVQPLCSHVIAPAELPRVYADLLRRKPEYMGVVVDWENESHPEADWSRPPSAHSA